MIAYSIIIPHKDIPDLLQRCLDSIPERDDIQTIIVDDNSSPDIVDFEHFPGNQRKNTQIYFTKEGRGAGYARNVGLKHAEGKWLIFSDADDFFADEFSSILDEMIEAEEDLVFFDHRSVLSDDTSTPAVRTEYTSKYIAAYLNGDSSETNLRCKWPVPTGKIIRRSIVEANQITFSETRWSNDVFFSAQVACFANKIRVTDRVGYVMTVREGSLISDFCGSQAEVLDRLQETIKSERLYSSFRIPQPSKLSNDYLWITYRKHGFFWCLRFCIKNLAKWPVAKATGLFLAKRILRTLKHLG